MAACGIGLSAFLSTLTYIFLRICLFLEATGICSAWVLAINKTIAGYQRDEVYIGTAEERAAKDHADDDEQLHMGPGHPRKLPVLLRTYPGFAEADEVRCIRQGVPRFHEGNGEWYE
jgi:hypothetical protein